MLHRLTHSPVVFLTFFFLLLAAGDGSFTSRAAPQAAPAKHGLTGNYYVSNYATRSDTKPTGYFQFAQVWQDSNDFDLPRPFGEPATVRVDLQVASGQGKGFSTKPAGPTVIWWPTGFAIPAGWPSASPNEKPWNYLGAVIWKGYIHFPKAGTYYLATTSNGPSAVYLNQARVALNGIYGGALVSDAFSYAKEEIGDFVQNLWNGQEDAALRPNPGQMYVVPVPISAPRDLPIEVAYNPMWPFTHRVSEPLGIDLFWVTPDSPRDANGKPIAKIVPGDVLYSEPPGKIEKPPVRSANSMISSDFLYATVGANHVVTLTVRLADKAGRPIAGKRVWVSGLEDSGPADTFTQPEKPTDENGTATAKVLAGDAHESTFFATDLTDLVDVAQVGHVTFKPDAGSRSFFPDTFAPYYDGHVPLIEPLPLRVGRPATIKAPVVNRLNSAMEVTVTFEAHDWNIGASNWTEIGEVKDIRLQPGETREVSITWTPQRESGDVCFRVSVSGHPLSASLPSGAFVAELLPFAAPRTFAAPAGGDANFGSQTHNGGAVGPKEPLWQPYSHCGCQVGICCNALETGYADGYAGRPERRDFSEVKDDPNGSCFENQYAFGYVLGKEDHDAPPPPPPPPPPRVAKSSWPLYDAGWYDGCTGRRPGQHGGLNPSPEVQDYFNGYHNGQKDCGSHPEPHDLDPLAQLGGDIQKFSEYLFGCEQKNYVPGGVTKASLWQDDSALSAARRAAEARRLPAGNVQPAQICFERTKTGERPYYRTTAYQTGVRPAPFILSHVAVGTNPVQSQAEAPPAPNKRQSALLALFELASDFQRGDATSRSNLLALIEERIVISQEENLLMHAPVLAQPDSSYRRLAPAAADMAYAYISALRSSHSRFQGALAAGDRDWGAKQLKATQEYAALAAARLTAEAVHDDGDLAELQKTPLAVRRSSANQVAFAQQLKTSGLSPELVQLMRESGSTDAQIAEFQKQIVQLPPQDIGISPAEMLKEIAASRRSLAVELTRLAQATPGALAAKSAQTFDVGNPHDKEETIDLFIRPVSIPPDWKLSVTDGEEQPKFKVREVEAGKHYAVTLPAKAQVKVASLVVPVGDVGTNTTARWAVEGKIGDELIGGMVHEMNVPYIIADLKLPPLGSKEVEEEIPAPSRLRLYLAVAIAGVLIIAALMFLVFWRKRQAKIGPN